MNYPYFYPQNYQQNYQQVQQRNDFVSAPSIEYAFNYPVAPGNAVTFRIENSPYLCVKSKGLSQLEQPTFEKYRLVKEDVEVKPTAQEYALKDDVAKLTEEIERLKTMIGGNHEPTGNVTAVSE